MSEIYIKGMAMPKKYPVTVTIFPDGVSVVKTISGRRFTATAIPIPKHGRLGDLDAVEAEIREKTNEQFCVNIVHAAPTIIPAEEGET